MKRTAEELEQRKRSHEWACMEACVDSENLRRSEGRWQIRIDGHWRMLDPLPPLGELVK